MAIDRLDVRLIDISRSGCLLESRRHVPPGASGEIRIDVNGRVFTETVRVTRCRHIEGAGEMYRLGTEFIRSRPLDECSLRRALVGVGEGTGTDGGSVRLVP